MRVYNKTIWSTENLVMFGMWLVNKGEYGYGLLCIHGSCLGLKIGTLLQIKWKDLIDINGECMMFIEIFDKKKDEPDFFSLTEFLMQYTEKVYRNNFHEEIEARESPIYINSKTGKVLTTSSLNRELNKFYSEFKLETYSKTNFKLTLRELKTNSFEIAWARDFVAKYNFSKKVFIIVSKHMGHRTVNDTINLLEIEPQDEIIICHDLFNPNRTKLFEMEQIFTDNIDFKRYLLGQNIIEF